MDGGYRYNSSGVLADLTAPEMRRFMEGKRVDAEIERMATEIEQEWEESASGTPTGGYTRPRESDDELLRQVHERHANGGA